MNNRSHQSRLHRGIAVCVLLSVVLGMTGCGDPERQLLKSLYTVQNGLEKAMKEKRVLRAEGAIDAATDTRISRVIVDISNKVVAFKNAYLDADLSSEGTSEALLKNIQEITGLIGRLGDETVLGIKNPNSLVVFKAAMASMTAATLAAVVAFIKVRDAVRKKGEK